MSWDTMAWARRVRTGNPGRKAVLMVLAEYADEADSCYPSQATLAAATEQSERTVRRQLAELEAMGLLHRSHRGNGNGGRTSDRYHLHVADTVGGLAANLTGGVTGQPEQGYRPNRGGLPATVGHQTPVENTIARTPTTRAEPLLPDLFDSFWRVYPRRTAKADARKAWARAVAKASPEVVLEGARRYAADPNLPTAEYVPHPATWLNGERWADGPLPARTNGRANGRAAPARKPIMENTAEFGARVLTDDELWGDS